MKAILLLTIILLAGCTQSIEILENATHACGVLHVEGTWTDTQGDIVLIKAPESWSAEQVREFCDLNG
ncbi:MAG: hypothetical protein COA78_25220 [Blastopirellula sp.]|nr:MAG: hypothetical protein COA78_25220 [Blastopirellula sp.]